MPAGARPPSSSSPDCTTCSATWLCPTRTSGESASSSVASARLVAEDVLPDRVARRAVVERDAVGRALRLEAVEKLLRTAGSSTSRVQRRGDAGVAVELVEVDRPAHGEVVVAREADVGPLRDGGAALVRPRPVADEVAEAPELVRRLLVDRREDRLQRVQVRVDVGDDCDAHRQRRTLTRRERGPSLRPPTVREEEEPPEAGGDAGRPRRRRASVRPATTTPSSAGASRSSQPMSAEPKIACCRLGSGVPAATGLGTLSSVVVALLARSAFPRRARRRARRARRGRRGSTRPARRVAMADAAARHATAISAVPAASCTSPLASQATNQSPAATGGQTHQRRLPRKNPSVAASTGVPKVASRASQCGPCGTTLMMSTPAPSSAAGTASQIQLRPRARACRAGAATVAACAAQSTAYDGTRESVSSRPRRRPSGRAPRAGCGCPRASRTSTTSPAAPR